MSKKAYFWEKLFPLVAMTIIGLVGYLLVDWLAAKRDRTNKQRDLRTEYLISTYSKLANVSERPLRLGSQYVLDLETAMADIQLFGCDSQIADANKLMTDLANSDSATETSCSLNELLKDLRDDLREEMGLPKIEKNVQWLCVEGAAIPE